MGIEVMVKNRISFRPRARRVTSDSLSRVVSSGSVALLLFGVVMVARESSASPTKFTGSVRIDGSSTVYPITEAVTEEFSKTQPDVRVPVGISGTGGGFKKFCAKEIDISNASRPMKATEAETCKASGVQFIEIPVGYDALTVVVHPKNSWAKTMTTAELKKLWEPAAQGTITKWNQIRPEWPDVPIKLFGPGTDSGTFDYFTESIVGKEDASRGDYTSSEDDNVIVQGVSRDVHALGYMGMAYFSENRDKIASVAIDDGKDEDGAGAIVPSAETVKSHRYQPLSRPLFVYVSKEALGRAEVREYVRYYLESVPTLVGDVGCVPLSPKAYALVTGIVQTQRVGSLFAGAGSLSGLTMEEFLEKGLGKGAS
jgi:phosphate transport system substrate-binding protein